MKLLIVPTLLMACAGPLSQAQPPRAGLIRPGVDSLSVFVVSGGDTTATGLVIDEIAVVERDGRRVIRRVYQTQDRVLGVRLDTIVDEAITLRPISTRIRSSATREIIDFRNGRATGWMIVAHGDSVSIDVPMPNDAYGAGSFDLVLRSAPLSDGWRAVVPSFVTAMRTVMPMSARVAGIDDVDGAPAWRIQAEVFGMSVTFWIDQATRRLVRQAMQIRPDFTILFARPRLATSPPRRTSA